MSRPEKNRLSAAGFTLLTASAVVFYSTNRDQDFFSRTALFSATSLGFALLMPAVMDLRVPRKPVVEGLWRNMALWSYSLYLSNLLIYNLIQAFWVEPAHKTKFNALLATAAYLTVSVLLSAFVYRHYELPMMKLRDSSSAARAKRLSLNRA